MTDSYNGDGTAGFVAGSDTSEVSAAMIDPTAAAIRSRVFRAVLAAGRHGIICDEVEAQLGLKHQTASARIRELVLRSEVYDSGYRRKTRSLRPAVVWLVQGVAHELAV